MTDSILDSGFDFDLGVPQTGAPLSLVSPPSTAWAQNAERRKTQQTLTMPPVPAAPVNILDAPMPQVAPARTYRKFTDTAATRQAVYDRVLQAAQELEPVANTRFQLSVEDVGYVGPEKFSLADQKKALLSRGSLQRKLRGTFVLRDLEGNELGRKTSQLAKVPYVTDRGTMIMGGNEYTMSNQMRLRPGVYTRRKQNQELESHVNVSKGMGHRIFMDPETGIFRVQMQQAKIPLFPLLKAMGVSNEQLQETWGPELTASNSAKKDAQAIDKLYKKLYRNKDAQTLEAHEKQEAVAQAFRDMELDPVTTEQTLGQGFTNVGPETLLAITKKLIRVNNGEDEPDDRDSMVYQKMVGPDDILAERIKKAKNVTRQILWKASARGNLDQVPANSFQDALQAAILSSGLASPLEEINPAEIFDQQVRVTRMGEGGIGSLTAVPEESRAVQPSQLGFIDFLRTPESGKVGVDARIAQSAVRGEDGTIYTTVMTPDGKIEYKSPQEIAKAVVAFPGEMAPGKKVAYAMVNGKVRPVDPATVDYMIPDMESTFSPLGNMIPFKSAVKGQRAVMASRMLTQALPLEQPEAPWVQSGMPDKSGRSFEEYYAEHMGALKAKQGGKVLAVHDDKIQVQYEDGKKEELEMYHNFPFNRKTLQHQTAVVKPGDQFQAGDLLARSNFTDEKGVTALGKNLRVAYVPWGGLNFEDAVVVSEDTAKKMASTHMYQHSYDWEEKDKRGKNAFASIFPAKYPAATLKNFDDAGVIKPGTKVKQGDPLILAVGEQERNHKSLMRGNKTSFKDKSLTWDHHHEGVVTDVIDTEKGTAVVVKASMPLEVGDKLCYDAETEVLTRQGWIPISQIELTDEICTLRDHKNIEYQKPRAVMAFLYHGDMVGVNTQDIDLLVTPGHKVYASLDDGVTFGRHRASHLLECNARYSKTAGWCNTQPSGCCTATHYAPIAGPKDIYLSRYDLHAAWGAMLAAGTVLYRRFTGRPYGVEIPYVSNFARGVFQTNNVIRDNAELTTTQIISTSLARQFISERANPHSVIPWRLYDSDVLYGQGRRQFYEAFIKAQNQWGAWFNQQRVNLSAPNKAIADLLQLCFLQDGYTADIFTFPGGQGAAPHYWLNVARRAQPVVRHNLIPGGKERTVYCVQVPNRVLYVRRNGKTCWSGNSGRYGDKGIISHIIPQDKMPTDESGKPYDILLNPLGVTSRTNPAQVLETALGKIAEKTGKPFKMPDWDSDKDLIGDVLLPLLAKHGEKPTETIIDPETGRKIPKVHAGNRWFMKLHHIAESKAQGRGLGSYTAEMTPAKGGAQGAKRVGMLELSSLLSHGAVNVIRDAGVVRGQANPDYWAQYMSGFKPSTPDVPHVYKKFVNSLKASGINVVRDARQVHLMALTNKDIEEMAEDRELQNVETVDWRTMEPIKGGLFDKKLTGGHMSPSGGGNRWSYIKLQEPLPNPVMEEPIRRLLGLTKNKFSDVLAGKEQLRGQTGPKAIQAALDKIDLPREIENARAAISSGKKTARDEAVRKLGYLKSAERLGIHPRDWVLDKVPVLPPAFRPVSTMGAKKLPLVADPNYLYKELWEANQALKDLTGKIDDNELGDERLNVYNTFKAVTGLGEPTHPEHQERQIKGILQHVLGNSPKTGMVQRRLLGASTDFVGRAVIAPDPNLDMDQVGLPENQAWDIYSPVVVRRLVQKGMSRVHAAQAVKEQSSVAREALMKELEDGIVLINRAPTLHRYGIMAAKPQLVKGDTLKISPLVVGGFGADFDGDAMQYHVLIDDAAKREAAEKMLPSKNLFSVSKFQAHYLPSQEYIAGLHEASARKSTAPPLTFATVRDAITAYRQGKIDDVGRQVHILEK